MTDTVQLALITAIPPTIAALAALLVGLQNRAKATDTSKKVDAVIEKAVEIHTLTNGTNSVLQKSLEVAQEKIAGLEALISSVVVAKQEADAARATNKVDVAQALAQTPPRSGSIKTRSGDHPDPTPDEQ